MTNVRRAHISGICGKGTSAIASLLRDAGYEVTGTTGACHPPVKDFLETENLATYTEFDRSHITNDLSLVVTATSATLELNSNEEVDEAIARGIPVETFPETLKRLSADHERIVIAGSSAKTTCTSLVAWILEHVGTNPSYFIGEMQRQFATHGHLGTSNQFVIEGDEYPVSRDNPQSKFLVFPPHDVLLTSATHDHVNIFPTQKDFEQPFRELLNHIPDDGILVACTDNEPVRDLIANHKGTCVTYGLIADHTPHYTARNITYGETTTFDLVHKDEHVISISTPLLGEHNIQNIVGAAAMILEKGLVSAEHVAAAIADYHGVPRRLERIDSNSNVPVYEGYGTSHEKAVAAIAAIKLHFPDRRLVVVFEPHTFSWRNRDKLYWYDDVFAGVDHVFIYKPLELSTPDPEQLTHDEIVDRVSSAGISTTKITSGENGIAHLESFLDANDVLLILTSGPIDGMITTIPELCTKLFPKK